MATSLNYSNIVISSFKTFNSKLILEYNPHLYLRLCLHFNSQVSHPPCAKVIPINKYDYDLIKRYNQRNSFRHTILLLEFIASLLTQAYWTQKGINFTHSINPSNFTNRYLKIEIQYTNYKVKSFTKLLYFQLIYKPDHNQCYQFHLQKQE